MNENDLDKKTLDRDHKKKRKKNKLLNEMENMSDCIIEDSEKNRIFDAFNVSKNIDKSERTGISYCKKADPNISEINENDLSSENFDRQSKKKKKKRKSINEMENLSDYILVDSNISGMNKNDLENQTPSGDHKKKKKKNKLLNGMENMSDCIIEDSEKNRIFDAFNVSKNSDKSEQTGISYCKTADSNISEINENDLTSENFDKHSKKKKKKRKSINEMENSSDYILIDSNIKGMNKNDLEIQTLSGDHKQKKKKNKSPNEIENMSDCIVKDLEKNKIFDAPKNIDKSKQLGIDKISDFKTVDSNTSEIIDLSSESFDGHSKKKKKKHKSINETENSSFFTLTDSNIIGMNKNDLDSKTLSGDKKKKKHKLLDEMENMSKCNIDKSENNIIFNEINAPKNFDEFKKTDTDKISDCETADSNISEINKSNLGSGTLDGLNKSKRKKLAEVEIMPESFIESDNSIVDDRINRNFKAHSESGLDLISDNLLGKEQTDRSKRPEEKNYQENEESYLSFDPFIHDIAETPVAFHVPLLHEDETVATIKPEKRAYLEENGVTVETGKWTKTEDDILTRNFQQFSLEFYVNNPFQLLGINQNRKNPQLSKYLKAKHFFVRLGKDLNNRSLRSIYMRARKLLNPLAKKKSLGSEELSDLKHAHELVGNKWTRISEMLSRTDNNCHTAFRWHKSGIKKGKWTPEEEEKLIKAIKTVTKSEDISANNVKNISWKEVAKYVPSRNEFQCQKQWVSRLAWDASVTEKKPWEKFHYGQLIYLIKDKYCFNSEREIDFTELHKHFKHVAASPSYLRRKWLYLKARLPKELNLSYNNCLDALAKMYDEQYKIFAFEDNKLEI